MHVTIFRLLAVTAAIALPALLATAQVQEAADPQTARITKAREAIKGLGEGLKEKLLGAMKDGGPVAALDVCKVEAPKIAAERSAAAGLDVGRTALKIRNPANAPSETERKVLEEFAKQIASGADSAKLEHAAVVEEGGKKSFLYMKPIMTAGKPCLACHGSELEPAVAAKIKELYPSDQATGFNAGDLRGAFVVTGKVE
ncbi:MAG: DUF3365 domain-containing protein [Hyphomicrobiaceae bacterium]|nr:DUF3365 domain-containing protein [Hyphomicrobiaceae bacterium]